MSADQVLVLIAGIIAIAAVNWWFFAGHRPAHAASAVDGIQELTVVVDGGYSPSALLAQAGVPLRLTFDRRDRSGCSEEVVLPDFGIRRFLPSGAKTAIELPAPSAGRYEFTCGMGMLRGSLTVEPGREP
jgi:plastocyanin domain-containing protein